MIVPLNIFLKETELAHIMNDAEPTLVVTTPDRVVLFRALGVRNIVTMTIIYVSVPSDMIASNFSFVTLDPNEMVVLLYTSGTTGFPKGVMLSSRNIMINILQGGSRISLDFGQRVFGVLPLFHSFIAIRLCVGKYAYRMYGDPCS